jgi:hypothetical protein
MQDSLTAELAQMARQLKLNTLHFSSSLDKDTALLAEAEGRLGQNLGKMKQEGGRLGSYSRQGRATTCFVVAAVAAVSLAWVVMFFLIRLT